MKSTKKTPILLQKQCTGAADLEANARREYSTCVHRTLTDEEWGVACKGLLAFFKLLHSWEQRRRTDEPGGNGIAVIEIEYPKAA